MIVKISHSISHSTKRFHFFLLLLIVSVSFEGISCRFQAVFGTVVVNFNFQNVHDGNWQQQKDKHGDPLQFLIEFDAILEATICVDQLR